MNKKVIVIGGGVAGMSAVHELIQRGFSVEVYEARDIPGGKARSVSVPSSGVGGRKDLPGEHGFRFFPRFYRNLPQTMRGTPYGNNHKSTFDNLVQASRELIARAESPNVLTLARFPRNLADFKVLLEDVFAPIGLTSEEEHFAAERLWQIATSCKERRANDYERLSWWEYVEADRFSDNYRALFAVGFTRTLVAARARSASTAVGGSILLQLIYGAATPGPSTDRLLNGPTNDMWIDPWLAYLRKLGVDYRLNSPVTHVHCADGLIQKVDVNTPESSLSVEGDYYLFAVPIEVMAKFLESSDILKLDQSLETLLELSQDVAWMNGMQLYLNKEIDLDYGHTMYVDSPWALTSVSQIQFWPDFDLSEYGDGEVKGILSIDISNWDAKGLLEHPPDGKRKSARECTKEEIKNEVVAQMAKSLNKKGQEPVLVEEYVHSWYLDSDIEPVDLFSRNDRYQDAEPLLVNKINTWHLRPETHTHIPNLFLAADYVKTDISLATWIITNSFFKTGWITAAILSFGVLIIFLIYIIRTDDQLLGKFLLFGLSAGFVELLADAWLVARTKTLFYEHGEPLLLDSPVYMPIAWAVILVQIGYLGYTFYLRKGLLFATILTGLIGGAIIPIYEYSAKGAGWWLYEDLHRMFLNATPYYIILGEFLLALALPGFLILCQRKQFYWALPLGAAMGIWIWIAYFISFSLVG